MSCHCPRALPCHGAAGVGATWFAAATATLLLSVHCCCCFDPCPWSVQGCPALLIATSMPLQYVVAVSDSQPYSLLLLSYPLVASSPHHP